MASSSLDRQLPLKFYKSFIRAPPNLRPWLSVRKSWIAHLLDQVDESKYLGVCLRVREGGSRRLADGLDQSHTNLPLCVKRAERESKAADLLVDQHPKPHL